MIIATTEDIKKLTAKIEEANNTLSTLSDGTHKVTLENAITVAQNIATKTNPTTEEITNALNNLSKAIENAVVVEQDLISDFVITTYDSAELDIEALHYGTSPDFAEILAMEYSDDPNIGYISYTLRETFTSADVALIHLGGNSFKFTVTNSKFFKQSDIIQARFYIITKDGERKLHETQFDYLIDLGVSGDSVVWEGWNMVGERLIEDAY